MATASGKPGRVTALLAICALTLPTGRLGAADAPPKSASDVSDVADKDLKQRALKLNDYTGAGPVKGAIETLVKDPAGTKRLLAAALQLAKQKDQPFNLNATYILGESARRLKDNATAETFYRLNLDQAKKMGSAQGIDQAFEGLMAVFAAGQRYADCEKLCKEILDIDEGDNTVEGLKLAVLRRLILVMAREHHFDKADELVDKLIKARPDNWLNVQLKGVLLREEGKDKEAAKLFEDLYEKIKDDKRLDKDKETKAFKDDLLADVRYRLSGVYIDLDQVDKAAEQLKALLEKDPDNPTYNNDLGYVWADHGKNLAESERLIRKAIEEDRKLRHKNNRDLTPEEDRDNAAFLDSLGWVLYKQKKYDEAKPYLEKAIKEEEGKHIEIYDHLGDLLAAMGQKSEAVAAWKKGVEVAGKTNRELQRKSEVEKKLKSHQK